MHRMEKIWIGVAIILAVTAGSSIQAIATDRVVVVPLFGSSDEISTVKSKTGKIWMDRNLGAIRVAGSKSDSLAYGWLYQWGRPADGHESRTSPKFTDELIIDDIPGHGNFIEVTSAPFDWRADQNDSLWQGVSGKNNPCPKGFRLPTAYEWQAELDSWNASSNYDDAAYMSPLKLVVGGYRPANDATVFQDGLWGCYWSSNVISESRKSRLLFFNKSNGTVDKYGWSRAASCSVRCIRDY